MSLLPVQGASKVPRWGRGEHFNQQFPGIEIRQWLHGILDTDTINQSQPKKNEYVVKRQRIMKRGNLIWILPSSLLKCPCLESACHYLLKLPNLSCVNLLRSLMIWGGLSRYDKETFPGRNQTRRMEHTCVRLRNWRHILFAVMPWPLYSLTNGKLYHMSLSENSCHNFIAGRNYDRERERVSSERAVYHDCW